ncbi:RsmB/NOP family class I SAM-dependent RNA methyltransferase [Rubritalea sp.]|uniref:RsmB/NOP family class I SAM-dependent RNA methyltransferase n=1 Tax=Rubritalea sp. TaxID=2109375 RepID=UPI003EF75417
MRMHRLLAIAAADIIHAVFYEHKVLDHSLAKAFEANPKWGKRDRNFIAETVFEVVRWRRALGFLAQSETTEALCAAQWTRMGYELPEWWSHDGASADTIKASESELASQPRAIRESIPDWLDTLGAEELGDAWDAELAALNQRARVYLRVNTLRATRSEVIQWLDSYHIPAHEVSGLPDTLVLNLGKTLPKSLRMDGRVEIQDAGSQMIAPLLAPKRKDCVIDTCAGAGGKSLHLAALMHGQGRIISMDIVPKKLHELERRAKRAKALRSIQTHLIGNNTIGQFHETADRLLIDAPCSGLGTLKRQPDLKWRIKPETIKRIRSIQLECLESYSTMLKPGGRLVYATCSILPSENRGNVDSFLSKETFKLVEESPVSPAASGYDGFYAAVLEKLPNP